MSNSFFAAYAICPDSVRIFSTRKERDEWVFNDPNEGLLRVCLSEREARALIGDNLDVPSAYYTPYGCDGETWIDSEFPQDFTVYLAGESPTIAEMLFALAI